MSMGIPEFDPRMAVMLKEMDITGMGAHKLELAPSLDQYELKPGQPGLMVTTGCDLDEDFTMLKMVEPSEHADQFPDWAARYQRDYRLCEWVSLKDKEPHLGWFMLSRFIPLESQAQYEELYQSGVLADPNVGVPDWLHGVYANYLEGLNQSDPGQVHVPAACAMCESRDVELHIRKTTLAAGKVGSKEITVNGETYTEWSILHTPSSNETVEAHLHCNACEGRGELDEEELSHLRVSALGLTN